MNARPEANPDRTGEPISAVLACLESETRAHPYESKRLIGPDVAYGRELLVALARGTGGWIGWEATSLRRIAGEITFVPLHAAGIRVGDDVEIRVIVSRALDRAIAGRNVSTGFAALGRSLGFRQALRDSMLELRIAGITPSALHAATVAGSPAREVAAVMREYDAILTETGTADSAAVFRMALDHFDDEARYSLKGRLLLAPVLVERGLPGELLDRLVSFGARVLDGDSAVGSHAPRKSAICRAGDVSSPSYQTACKTILAWAAGSTIPAASDEQPDQDLVKVDSFVAATPSDELREVFRRVVGEGLRWDDIEIVTTDVDSYGIALDVLCQQLDVGGTILHGIPLARTRLGRALERWFAWLENGLPADLLRQALEAGEIGANMGAEPAAIARELREQQIGWGRDRYEAALLRLESGLTDVQRRRSEGDSDEEYEAHMAARRNSVTALRSLLAALLGATPDVPERGKTTIVRSTAALLATSTLAWLTLVHLHGAAEQQTASRVRARLEALAKLDTTGTTFGAALATLRDTLSDVRAWPLRTSESKPRSSNGGMVHLTDVAHAGTTGRRRIFIVGLDADATGGSSRQDPLIPDAVRVAIASDALSTTSQRREDKAFVLGSVLASLRGRVTMSYAMTDMIAGGEAGPAAVLLQLHRVIERTTDLSYSQLRERLGPQISAVPSRGGAVALLDARDVWLDVIAGGSLLLNGEDLVRSCFPSLSAGMRARDMANGPELTQFGGMVSRAAGALDPRARPDRAISASALQKLAECPLSWFYHYGLSLRPPQDPAYDPDVWLDSAMRGALLHEVFEKFGKRFADRGADLASSAADDAMTEIVESVIAWWLAEVPPPSDNVRDHEVDDMRRAAFSFLTMERAAIARGNSGRSLYFEYEFGNGDTRMHYPLADGTSLAIKGRVDRIDEMDDGSYLVIDYKTGRANHYGKTPKLGKFRGGRQLQPAIYTAVLDQLLAGRVANFEYRFPTESGQNRTVAYSARELTEAQPIVTQLLEHVRDGTFVPTNSSDDCKFCNARPICRVEEDKFGKLTSPPAEWAHKHASGIDAYRGMLSRRDRDADT
jgi:RecB family exonuclease